MLISPNERNQIGPLTLEQHPLVQFQGVRSDCDTDIKIERRRFPRKEIDGRAAEAGRTPGGCLAPGTVPGTPLP
jgi:hypothetical protein